MIFGIKNILKFCLKIRKWIIVWLAPIILLFIPILFTGKESKCVFVVLLMIIYWLTEAVPLAITSLIPIFLFPFFDILSTKQVSNAYINDTLMVFLGSIMATVAIEQSNLHQRIALRILMLFGTSPIWLLLGFMSATSFISLWISDTATTALMVPIIEALLSNFQIEKRTSICSVNNNISGEGLITITHDINDRQIDEINCHRRHSFKNIIKKKSAEEIAYNSLRKSIYLSVAYSSLIGGTGTITGTSVNMIFKGMANNLGGDNVTFANWMCFAIPPMVVNIILVWIFMILVFVRRLPKSENSAEKCDALTKLIQNKYNSLGKMSFHEISVLIVFSTLLCLWFFRAPDFLTGWSPAIHHKSSDYINDASAAMLMIFICFIIPSNPKDLVNSSPLMTWQSVQAKVPWGIFILMGGAFAMASGIESSGLSHMIGSNLMRYLKNLHPILLMIITSTLSMFFVEMSSNAATISIFLPLVKQLAISKGMSPLQLMLPVTVSCSFAFMFPNASPTNAIVYQASNMTTSEMAIPGFFLKIICLTCIIISSFTWGHVIYNLHDFKPNITISSF